MNTTEQQERSAEKAKREQLLAGLKVKDFRDTKPYSKKGEVLKRLNLVLSSKMHGANHRP